MALGYKGLVDRAKGGRSSWTSPGTGGESSCNVGFSSSTTESQLSPIYPARPSLHFCRRNSRASDMGIGIGMTSEISFYHAFCRESGDGRKMDQREDCKSYNGHLGSVSKIVHDNNSILYGSGLE